MSEASDAMAARLRPLLNKKLGLVEKKMFGGIGFMLDGNMLIGTTAKGQLLVRVDPEEMDKALKRPGAEAMHMGPRVMSGFLAVSPTALRTDSSISNWIEYALQYVSTLPAK